MIHTMKVERDVKITKLALCGRLRSGKDEIGKHLYLKHSFGRVAFGDKLKELYHDIFPWEPIMPKPRAGYQFMNTMRQHDPDVWIRHTERKVDGIIKYNVHTAHDKVGVVITDVRQQNEVDWCRNNGFTLIRITAPDELRIERAKKAGDSFTEADLCHKTESEIDGFSVDYEIVNDGTVDELKAKIDAVLEAINCPS